MPRTNSQNEQAVSTAASPSAASQESAPKYVPGLDGIRAIAVIAVVLYHLKAPFADGGLLGVSVFFTLSGYLITSLLLGEFQRSGRIDLKGFWVRRARRLLPAIFVLLPVVALATLATRPEKFVAVLRDGVFALLYVSNWATILRGDDYFQRFSGPGPLDHLWSLAIEEQFYVVWPLAVAGVLAAVAWRARKQAGNAMRSGTSAWLAAVAFVLAAASTWAMFAAYDPSADNNTRAYEGTDTRAAALLIGALVAALLPLHRVARLGGAARIALDVLATAGLAVVLGCIAITDEYSPFLYRGGEVLLAIATSLLVLGASHPQTLIGRVLALGPMRWIGARSYGIYLWHMPIAAFVPEVLFEQHPLLCGAISAGLIVALATISYHLVEDPVRRGVPLLAPVRFMTRVVPVAAIATIALAAGPIGFPAATSGEVLAEDAPAVPSGPIELVAPGAPGNAAAGTRPQGPVAPVASPLATSCLELVHVGDSTSIALASPRFLPNPDDRIAARYAAVGVERFWPEISGARSMVERLANQENATAIVRRHVASGYDGCFVLALGTNDPANTSGNAELLTARIDAVMRHAGSRPVLWTTTKTLRSQGPYRNAHMEVWNRVVVEACERYPNMRVYDYASEVRDDWFSRDQVHPNSAGARERSLRIATALARAFPKDGTSSTCVISGAP
jgi:peptidoglycan/LPS O-acetylase OafA/YrhL